MRGCVAHRRKRCRASGWTPTRLWKAFAEPSAADAPSAVARPHPQRSRETAAPGAEEEAQRTPALAEADILEWGELVEGGGDEDCADDPASCPVPDELIAEKVAAEVRDPEGEEACAAPGEQVAGGSGPLVHAAHPIGREPPRESGESKEQSDEAVPGTRGGERWRQPRGSRAKLVRCGDHLLRQPRRSRRDGRSPRFAPARRREARALPSGRRVAELLPRSRDVLTSMQQRRELGAVMLVLNERRGTGGGRRLTLVQGDRQGLNAESPVAEG